jgi:hypothetical protein
MAGSASGSVNAGGLSRSVSCPIRPKSTIPFTKPRRVKALESLCIKGSGKIPNVSSVNPIISAIRISQVTPISIDTYLCFQAEIVQKYSAARLILRNPVGALLSPQRPSRPMSATARGHGLDDLPVASRSAQLRKAAWRTIVLGFNFRSNRFGSYVWLCQPESGVHLFKELINGIQCC